MDNFEELKQLWQQAAPNAGPSAAEVTAQARKYRRKLVLRNMGGTLLLLFTAVYISVLAYHYHSKMLSTRIGEWCVLLAVAGMAILNTGLLRYLLQQVSNAADVHSYLIQLKAYRKRMQFIQTTGFAVYFILFTAGLGLYFYELTHNDLWFALLTYGLTGAWIAFNWFYVRPRKIRKQTEKLNLEIARLEQLSGQLE